MGDEILQSERRLGQKPSRETENARGKRPRLGVRDEDVPHHARPDARQSETPRDGVQGGGAWSQRHRGRLPGTAAVDRLETQRRLRGGPPQHAVRLERQARGGDPCHGERRAQRHGHALRPPADPTRPDLQRRAHLLESRGGETRHRQGAYRQGRQRYHPPHQLRRHHPRRQRLRHRPRGQPDDEAVVGADR